MGNTISKSSIKEVLESTRQRYLSSSKVDKTKILNELIGLTKLHRKHVIRLLKSKKHSPEKSASLKNRKIYQEAVRQSLILLWETSDRICSKRLKSIIPALIESMTAHGHIALDMELESQLKKISTATIDRILSPIRSKAGKKKKRKRSTKASKKIAVKTFADWKNTPLGFLEIDFVVHSGGNMSGSLIHSLVATDVCSGWTECVALLYRDQHLVVEAMKIFKQLFPFKIRGINSDNDGAFINETLIGYCEKNEIVFTRSRPYKKNDQAWIEQKNGAIVRKILGHGRYSGTVAAEIISQLYGYVRLYTNFYQPSFKLIKKERHGAKVKKIFDQPMTACDRVLQRIMDDSPIKIALEGQKKRLDPVFLLHKIRGLQTDLISINTNQDSEAKEDLEKFLSALPRVWKEGEVRPTHRNPSEGLRDYRTHVNDFDYDWIEIVARLEIGPDLTAKDILKDLVRKYPKRHSMKRLRTLQRRIAEWRREMAEKLLNIKNANIFQ